MGVNQEILKEFKQALEQGTNKDKDSISIYNVINLFRKKHSKCKLLDEDLCKSIIDLSSPAYYPFDIDYDIRNRYLIFRFDVYKMIFTKQYDCLNELNKGLYSDLILVESDYTDAKKVLAKYGQEISKRYDIFIKDISFYRDHMNNVHSTNSKFIISSDKNRINVKYKDYLTLSAMIYTLEYEYDCNSDNAISICKDKEAYEILKRIFVKINDCPEWTHEALYSIRKRQLEEQEKLEYKQQLKQERIELSKKYVKIKSPKITIKDGKTCYVFR